MKRWWLAATAGLATLLALVWANARGGDSASVHSRGGRGQAAAWAWAQERGEVAISAVPWSELPPGGSLVVTLPGVRAPSAAQAEALRDWVARGGTLTALLSANTPSPLAEPLGFEEPKRDRTPPAGREEWWAWAVKEERADGDPTLRTTAPTLGLECPSTATITHTRHDGGATACTWMFGEGRVVLVRGSDVFANGRLRQEENLALLASVVAGPPPVRFDDWVHGAGAAGPAESLGPGPWALLVHGSVLYAAALYPLARRLGAPARSLGASASSMVRDLRVLAALHRRRGHAAAAGARLVELARARLRGRGAERLPDHFTGDGAALLDLAREVARLERGDVDA